MKHVIVQLQRTEPLDIKIREGKLRRSFTFTSVAKSAYNKEREKFNNDEGLSLKPKVSKLRVRRLKANSRSI